MKKGWTYKKLGEVTSFQNGFAFKSSLFRKDGLPIVRISSIQDEEIKEADLVSFYPSDYDVNFDNYKIFPNDILIAMSGGTTGKLGINKSNKIFYQNQRVGVIREDKKYLDHLFLFYYLHTKSEESLKIAAGTAQPNLSTAQIRNYIIPLPSLNEQQRIVSRLDAAFAHIDELKANAEKQLSEARALFQASLKKILEPKEGWKKNALKEICKVINGRAYAKDEMLQEGKYRLLRVGNFFTNDSWYYSDLELEEDKYCDKGDLLYAWSASFGPKIWDGEKVIYHYHIWKMVCSNGIDKHFLYYWLDSDELKKQTMTNLHGTTMAHITKGIIEAAMVSYPPLSEQQRIVSRLDSLSAHVRELEEVLQKTIAECDALKQALLRKVFE